MNAVTPAIPLHILWLTNLVVKPDKKVLSKDYFNFHKAEQCHSQLIILRQDVKEDSVGQQKCPCCKINT